MSAMAAAVTAGTTPTMTAAVTASLTATMPTASTSVLRPGGRCGKQRQDGECDDAVSSS
jgi:hypothetical protein